MSSQRLNRLAHERGITFTVDAATSKSLLIAGAPPALVHGLRAINQAPGNLDTSDCPASLARAGELIRQKKYQEAKSILQKLITADTGDATLHFVMGYLCQQQSDWDEAFYSHENSRVLMPGLSDTHSRLAYLFYRSDDADNAIAETRTALSIDPKNVEAYRFLGLGLYANGQYSAAVRAFQGITGLPAEQGRHLLRHRNYSPRQGQY